MKIFTGHVKTDIVGSECTFDVEVEDDATDEDIQKELIKSMWESGMVECWIGEEVSEYK